jgi:transcriptional regulator with XRE-family HTH domain
MAERHVGRAISDARTLAGLSIRELGRRTGVSAAQLSRIEAGRVRQPSIDTLVAVATAVGRSPKALLIVSGHISGRERLVALRQMLGLRPNGEPDPNSTSDLIEEMDAMFDEPFFEAERALLQQDDPPEDELLEAAENIFIMSVHSDSSDAWGSFIGPLMATLGGDELQEHVKTVRLLPPDRRQKVFEYALEQRALDRLEWGNEQSEDEENED